jgi:hypothetical protein
MSQAGRFRMADRSSDTWLQPRHMVSHEMYERNCLSDNNIHTYIETANRLILLMKQ